MPQTLSSSSGPNGGPSDVDVIIVGTGFSGLAMGTMLARETPYSFLMLERADSIGGTWRENTYPGAACDIQSHLYSYSFRPNPNWSRVYAPQPEILAYLQRTADDEGLTPRIRFGTELLAAAWCDEERRWHIHTPRGPLSARILVTASGHLSDPSIPDIPGMKDFTGTLFHSARWNHDCDLSGKRVGVVGTGASAIQIVPEIAPQAGELTIFQRSAPYVIPRRDRAYSVAEQRMFERMPEVARDLRDELFWGNEARFPQRLGVREFVEPIRSMALDHLAEQVSDAQLRAILTPDYEIGCKRVLISNDYYPTLARPNVHVRTEPIVGVNSNQLVLEAGEPVDLDVLIVATGFEATTLPVAERITGQDGELLAQHWEHGGRALACATVAGFPNMFVMLGPNTGLGAGSIIFMVETQVRYVIEGIAFCLDNDIDISPRQDLEDAFVESIYRRAQSTVWMNGGCRSWYVHPESGRLTTLWPDFMTQFKAENGSFDPSMFVDVGERKVGAP